jgi:hypothetical protein
MKFLAPALVIFSLVCLTGPDGFAVWISTEQVVSVLHPTKDECAAGSKAKVTFGNGAAVCVLEERKAIVDKLNEAK